MSDLFSPTAIMLGLVFNLAFGVWSYFLAKEKGLPPIVYGVLGAIITFPIVIILYKKKQKENLIPKEIAGIMPYANMYSKGGLTEDEFRAIQRKQFGLDKKD